MSRALTIGATRIHDDGDCYVIAEIGHNHQGSVEKAKEMFRVAKDCGVDAVKLQKRSNRTLYTRAMYESPYDNENSFGATYGAHREALEFGWEHVARIGKPLIVSTGGGSIDDVERAHDTVTGINPQLCLLQCTASYPAEPEDMNLRVITSFRDRFPRAVIGLSDHQNGIALADAAYVLGARVIEKHFTLNRASKGTDHAYSLEREGMRKLVRDLRRVRAALGTGVKAPLAVEKKPLFKMGKKLVAARRLAAGQVLSAADVAIKSPNDGLPPYELPSVLSRALRRDLAEDDSIALEDLI
jgi:N-acetylneuraminate synthase/sialic acid synthase